LSKHRDIGEQGAKLEQHAHSPAQGVQFVVLEAGHRQTVDQHVAAARLELSANQPQQRGLAATGAAHDGDHLAARNLHADAIEDRSIVVGKIEILDFDKIIGRHRSIPGQK
jgi:hypothetical protein